MKTLKVGTRKSPLAMKQTEIVLQQLKKINPQQTFEIIGISTKGDRQQQAPLTQIGGKGVFVKEVEYHLQHGTIDFAVHSLKDMPALLPPDLVLAATPKRANPLDCLIWREPAIQASEKKLVIGTSSLRRKKQMEVLFSGVEIVPMRGKIETRIEKMFMQQLSGTVLACAGLERMNYFSQLPAYQVLSPLECVPAVGQGILGVECRKGDTVLRDFLAEINDAETAVAAEAERLFLQKMNGNCDLPIGAFAQKVKEQWEFYAFLAENPGAPGNVVHVKGRDALLLMEEAYQLLR
jgi:hydroxymethylbilane synthase